MAKYQRLKSEHLQPVDAPISRGQARSLLIQYVMQVTGCSEGYADGTAVCFFDTLADAHDEKCDEAYEQATYDIVVDLENDLAECKELAAALADPRISASHSKNLERLLLAASRRAERSQRGIEKAQAKRALKKSDYRTILLKAANQIIREEELMDRI